MHELDSLRTAARDYRRMLAEAERLAGEYGPHPESIDPAAELARRLPAMIATLSPNARAILAEHADYLTVMVDALTEVIGSRHLRLVGPT